MVHLVAAMLDLVGALEDVTQILGGCEVLDRFHQDFRFLGGDVNLLLERVKVVELALLGHVVSHPRFTVIELYRIAHRTAQRQRVRRRSMRSNSA